MFVGFDNRAGAILRLYHTIAFDESCHYPTFRKAEAGVRGVFGIEPRAAAREGERKNRNRSDEKRQWQRLYFYVFIRAAGVSETGPFRGANEDRFVVDRDAGLFIVADGMGGHRAGEVASAMAVETIVQQMAGMPSDGGDPADAER